MAAKAVVVWDPSGNRVPNAECSIESLVLGLTNADGYILSPFSHVSGPSYVRVLASGFAPAVYQFSFDNKDQEIHLGGPDNFGPPNTIHLPALSFRQSALPAVPVQYPFAGALCIPDTLKSYCGHNRYWSTAFGCLNRQEQSEWLDLLDERKYKWQFYQLSGSPYHGDYPELPLDINRIVSDLSYIRSRGFGTIINFRDDVGTDCSYLRPVAEATQGLVDCCMGIFESNGVFDWDEDKVVSVLWQQHQLWPKAINAFHSTCQNNELRGFGEKSFWDKVSSFVDVYFLQQNAWDYPAASVANRAQDFVERLQGGVAGWPILKYGVILAEETTTATYHLDWTEQMGIDKMEQLLGMINPRPKGFLDGGIA